MSKITVYLKLWEYLRQHGLKTIQIIDNAYAWDFRIAAQEYSIHETFRHTVQAIYEDAGNWFLNDATRFTPTDNPETDLHTAIDRMIRAIKDFQDDELAQEFTFQWGEKTTISGAIQQNLFHAIGHFAQLRNWVGLHKRRKGNHAEKTYL